jgi:hypothetical protein
MLLFYPRFWKNALYAVLIGIALLLLPLVHIPANELVSYYHSWFVAVMHQANALRFYSIYRPICTFYKSLEPFAGLISVGVLFVILIFTFLRLKIFKESFLHRAQFLGIIMSWVILFGLGSERHTYVIAMVGYAIWYLCSATTRLDKVLLWINFVLLEILPIDILCPPALANLILSTFISWVLKLRVYYTQYGCKIIKRDLAIKLFQEPFISKWLFDVELFARIINIYGRPDCISRMIEIPLNKWTEKGGSKVEITYAFRLWFDLLRINRKYRSTL